MHKHPVVLAFLCAFFILAVVHNIATALFLYWTYLWFDIPMHILGGVVVALGYQALVLVVGERVSRRLGGVVPTLLAVLLAGILWEAFEVLIDAPLTGGYAADTALDMVMDVVGGLMGYIFAKRLSIVPE